MNIVKSKPFHVIAFVASALLVVGVATFAGPCVHDDGTVSACHGASQALIAAGAIGCIASLASLFIGNSKASGACALVAAFCGAFAAIAPGSVLGLCMMQTMRCWTAMRPFALVCGACLCLFGIVAGVLCLKGSERRAS